MLQMVRYALLVVLVCLGAFGTWHSLRGLRRRRLWDMYQAAPSAVLLTVGVLAGILAVCVGITEMVTMPEPYQIRREWLPTR